MSITRDQLIQFIEKPSLLKEQTIGELKEIVDEFPYFQSAQLLYTYNLFSQSNFRYSGYLKTCSIYSTDRTILYHLLQPTTRAPKIPVPATEFDETEHQSTELFELAEETLITEAEFSQLSSLQRDEGGTIDLDLLSFDQQDNFSSLDDPASSSEFTDLSVPKDAEESSVDQKVDLIEQFIKVNPTIQPRSENISERSEVSDLNDDPENENDEYITETLSRIYLKQGHYQKAIDSFSRLSLKFPEKSVYFAQQIEEIKKLLN
jgi:hypothetical protein